MSTTRILRHCGVAATLLAIASCAPSVTKQAHCRFVNDVGAASTSFKEAADTAQRKSWQAQADELRRTVQSEQQNYCNISDSK